ncbi:MAG: class I SAM-dependent methyltransferase [Candidatus Lindowbacteria bacterium]|nr:class I SAM-dependent methyltransferase [Candidatus Lindowbacteria bacterium]
MPDFRIKLGQKTRSFDRWKTVMEKYVSWRQKYLWKGYFEKFFGALTGKIDSNRDLAIHREIYKRVGVSGDILEVGCGAGGLKNIATDGLYAGIDPIQYDRKPDFRFCQGFAESLPYYDASFDAVFMVASFDYFFEPHMALREAKRVLRPGGSLGIALTLREKDEEGDVQFYRYTEKSLIDLVNAEISVHSSEVNSQNLIFIQAKK